MGGVIASQGILLNASNGNKGQEICACTYVSVSVCEIVGEMGVVGVGIGGIP